MTTSPLLVKAIEIATKAHEGQFDKSGLPYITHPLRVMDLVDTEEEKMVAVLHDVIEDTKITLEDLEREGFSGATLDELFLLTHTENVPYVKYIETIKHSSFATAVKIADLKDNTRLDRVLMEPGNIRYDSKRLVKYIMSYKYLTDQITFDEYVNALNER